MKKIINFILLCLSVYFTSCEPQRYCNEPKCAYSDVSTEIKVKLSGNLDSIIHVGDTIVYELNIPDTMATNGYGYLVINQLYQNSFFGITCGGSDYIDTNGLAIGVHTPKFVIINNGGSEAYKWEWNFQTHKFKMLIIFEERGNYVINNVNGRIEMKDKNGKEWLVNPNISFDSSLDKHQNLSINWYPNNLKDFAVQETLKYPDRYYLEVR